MEEKEHIMKIMEHCGFPGGFVSWDCKHFNWKNCPVHCWTASKPSWMEKPQFAIQICIFGTFFGQPGSMNDISVMNRSLIVDLILSEKFDMTCLPYQIDNRMFDWIYFLVNGHLGPFFVR